MLGLGKKSKSIELKKDNIQRVLRIVFWILLIFLVAKSVAKDVITKPQEIQIPEIKLEQQAPAAVASSFVKEYLTYDIQQSMDEYNDYKERVHRFGAEYINLSNLASVKASSKAENVFVFDIEKLKGNQYNVTVKGDVTYKFLDGKVKTSSIYLKVPVTESDGSFIVEDTPVMIPEPTKPDIDYIKFDQGEELYISETEKVKEIMKNFFKTYCSGKSTEIAYYMDDGLPQRGFEGRFVFLDIKEFNVFDLKQNSGFKAIVNVKLKDSVSNKEFHQNYNIDLVKKEERWYIKNLKIRGGNIYEKYENKEK
ncbi:conjugal transfer protein [Clostridiisalibacter paucivorans]|uniref:conjugal transfer protein n=1 Tax=Clostridiisalibacter paucivorans TaxID=408753 RepID=UPI00047DB56B|nr:conjugal transfer protein [Clostridiisalibacter paucivorans]